MFAVKSPLSTNSLEQKRKARLALQGNCFGAPKLRDLLREKCRIRMRESRQSLFDDKRRLTQDIHDDPDILKNFLRNELRELDINVELQEKLFEECISEMNDWFADQMYDEDNYLRNIAEDFSLVCPLCQKEFMEIHPEDNESKPKSFVYKCPCNARFLSARDVDNLRLDLAKLIDTHELHCLSALNFYVNPLTQQLEAICDSCDHFGTL